MYSGNIKKSIIDNTASHSLVSLCFTAMGGRGVENDITFEHTLYTEADPESVGGVHVILN